MEEIIPKLSSLDPHFVFLSIYFRGFSSGKKFHIAGEQSIDA